VADLYPVNIVLLFGLGLGSFARCVANRENTFDLLSVLGVTAATEAAGCSLLVVMMVPIKIFRHVAMQCTRPI
jgi:hypothetical protein